MTQACELNCDHCRAEANPSRHPNELTTTEGKQLLDDLRQFSDGQLVVLSGGDPLKRDDLVELVEYGTERGLAMTLTPSATTSMTKDILRSLRDAGLRRLALSLDGSTANRHDEFRGESGCFAATQRVARTAREMGLPLQINTTVCKETVDDLPLIRDRLNEFEPVLWSVFFLVPVGRGTELNSIPAPKAEQVMEWLSSVANNSEFGVKTTEAPMYRRVRIRHRSSPETDASPPTEESRSPPGGTVNSRASRNDGHSGKSLRRRGIIAGDGFAFVSHTGEVFPSGFLPQRVGSVRNSNIVDLYRHAELFNRLRDRGELSGKCGACKFRRICGGSRSRAFAVMDDPFASDPLCPYVPDGFEKPCSGG